MQELELFIPTTTNLDGSQVEVISMLIDPKPGEKVILKYLYEKIHTNTGMLYFGTTIQKDPVKYPGSGCEWFRPRKEFGWGRKFINTLRVWIFNNQKECTKFALNFSDINDIIVSDLWANLIPENGWNSDCTGRKDSLETKKRKVFLQ